MRRILLALGVVVGLAGLVAAAAPASAQTSFSQVDGTGPVTGLAVSDTLGCGLRAGPEGDVFGGTEGCGTVVAVGGAVWRPAEWPAGELPGGTTPWVPVKQSVGGVGTRADPFTITTDVRSASLAATQVDTFVSEESNYRTSLTVTNTGTTVLDAGLYHVADCPAASYGEVTANAAVTCRTAVAGAYDAKASGVEFATPTANVFYGPPARAWEIIAAGKGFVNGVGPGTSQAIDAAIGLSWSVHLDALDAAGNCPDGRHCSATVTMVTTYQVPVGSTAPASPAAPAATTDPAHAPAAPAGTGTGTGTGTGGTGGAGGTGKDGSLSAGETTSSDLPAPVAALSDAEMGRGLDPSVIQRYLAAPWSMALAVFFGLSGCVAASTLRRHGRPS